MGSRLRAEAREISLTRRTASYLITVTDAQDQLVATCQALVYRKEEKLPFLEEKTGITKDEPNKQRDKKD
jgi:acyl-CoA thioesterase